MIYSTEQFYRNVSLISLLIFILTAWFSIGYHHPDEHFQILEFANYKLGGTPLADLPWEYHSQIRPALPVFIAFCLFKVFGFIGISDPFLLAFLLRLITAVIAWRILQKLAIYVSASFQTEGGKKIFFALIFLLWFMPYISVRFSSENLAAIAFLIALYKIIKFKEYERREQFLALIFAGFLLGLSFYFRFQMGFAIFGLTAWLIFIEKLNWKFFFVLFFGGLLSVAICILIDFWFYGIWVLTPVNYFTANIVEDIASKWGVTPWWDYFYLFFIQGIAPISIPLLIFFFVGVFRKYKSVFLWCFVPFLIAHFMVGHKETRFMFPMIFSFIYLCAVGIDYFISTQKWVKVRMIVLYLLVIVNVPFLLYRSFSPARELISYQEFLYDFAEDKEIELVCMEQEIYRTVEMNIWFYRSHNVHCLVVENEIGFDNYLQTEHPNEVYFVERKSPESDSYKGYTEETLYSILPDWVLKININDWTSRAKIWKIKKLSLS